MIAWIKLNMARFVLLIGLALIIVASFFINLPLGLFITGLFLVIIASVSIISEGR